MGRHMDNYKRLEKAFEEFMDGLTDLATEALPNDVDADISYVDEVSGVDTDTLNDLINECEGLAKRADSGELASKLRDEFGEGEGEGDGE